MSDARDILNEQLKLEEFRSLTPMSQLVLEILAARLRLGHELWTFTNNSALSQAFRRLKEKGYIETMPGVHQGTVRAILTEKARDLVLDPTYVPPILEDRGGE